MDRTTTKNRTAKEQWRFDFFLGLIGWGNPRQARLGIIAQEDGGLEWTKQKNNEQTIVDLDVKDVDKNINKCIDKSVEWAVGRRFVLQEPHASNPGRPTEWMQCYTAIQLRKIIEPNFNADINSYFKTSFQQDFEVVGNLFPFAKPQKADDLDPRMKELVGYSIDTCMSEIYSDVLNNRLVGIEMLSREWAKRDGMLLFMGLHNYEEEIIARIGHCKEPDVNICSKKFNDKQYSLERKIRCWAGSKKAPLCCFVDHPSRWRFSTAVCDRMVEEVKCLGWA